MRKSLILVLIILLASSAVALASWQVASWIRSDSDEQAPGVTASTEVITGLSAPAAAQVAEHQGRVGAAGGRAAADPGAERTGESDQYDSPDQRYVTETQRHQNFFKALAEGRVRGIEVITTDFQPAGDPDSSYLYVIVALSSSDRCDGTIVMKYSGGLWRIGAVRLTGALAGGTSYNVPSSFEADLSRELNEQQEFLTKMAEGRLASIRISSVSREGEAEVVLQGEAASRGGSTFPAEMRLRKDYDLWHLTDIVAL